jgi:hypothetical protein
MTLYGYGATRMRKSSFGRFSIARTTRLRYTNCANQREMASRKRWRETRKTASAPESAAVYEIRSPPSAPNV